jgi:hypothetical protein
MLGIGAISIGLNTSLTGTNSSTITIGNGTGITNQISNSIYTIPSLTTLGGSPASLQYDTTTGQLGPLSSSRQYKTKIEPIIETWIDRLEAVSFEWKNTGPSLRAIGMIAENVVQYHSELTPRDNDGKLYTINYELLSVLLLHKIKHLEKRLQLQSKLISLNR